MESPRRPVHAGRDTMTREEQIDALGRVKHYTAEARENSMRIGMRWALEDAEREVDTVIAALREAAETREPDTTPQDIPYCASCGKRKAKCDGC